MLTTLRCALAGVAALALLAGCNSTGTVDPNIAALDATACANSKVNHDILAPLSAAGGPAAVAADTIAHNALVQRCGPLSPEYVAPAAVAAPAATTTR